MVRPTVQEVVRVLMPQKEVLMGKTRNLQLCYTNWAKRTKINKLRKRGAPDEPRDTRVSSARKVGTGARPADLELFPETRVNMPRHAPQRLKIAQKKRTTHSLAGPGQRDRVSRRFSARDLEFRAGGKVITKEGAFVRQSGDKRGMASVKHNNNSY